MECLVPENIASIDLDALRTEAEKAGDDNRDEQIDIQAFKGGTGHDGETPSDFSDMVEFNGTNFDNMLFYMGAWSTVTCAEASDDLPERLVLCPLVKKHSLTNPQAFGSGVFFA